MDPKIIWVTKLPRKILEIFITCHDLGDKEQKALDKLKQRMKERNSYYKTTKEAINQRVVVSCFGLRTTFWKLKKESKARWLSHGGDCTMWI